MRRLLLLAIFFISQPVFSGEVAKIYEEGVFGVKWGDPIENIKKEFPRGKREAYKQVIMYVIRDGRPLFDVKRKRNAFITFGFDPEQKLNSVGIDFQIEDYSKLLNNLDAQFGKHIMKSDNSTARIAIWPKDKGVELSLTMARAGFFSQEVKTSFNIIYTGE
ncbi:MAG: hypothetical protein KAS57_08880 [Gammaproteobacteria bacterium]|nr:hypothetical protein [Gammaproteobacteria bacterium]